MKAMQKIFAVLALLCVTQAFAAEPELGKDYALVKPAQPTHSGNKIEVLEFFFHGCSHCFKLHPGLTAWEKKIPKDVELTYVPTIFNPGWEASARTFYALEMLGQDKKLHDALFKAWNEQHLELMDEVSSTNFVVSQGVDRKKFADAYNSFAMQSKVARSKQMGQSYGIRGTPTLIVDGKYLITGLAPEDTLRVLDAVVAKARKEHSGKK
jgi:protein dithiol oxidoreductase (disulfide-forming)